MGSSAKRKKEKKQDFQKPKLKVGKAKAKPANQTDTSFRSKAIVLNQQSLTVAAPSASHQFSHHVSMLSSRSDSQRKDSLAYLTTYINSKPVNAPLPQPTGTFLDKACPLILDGSNSVRNQLTKMFQSLPLGELSDHIPKILPFVRAGMTHLSKDIRHSTIDLLSWLLETAGNEVVSCPGGWVKTVDSFVTLLGWKTLNNGGKWSSSKTTIGNDTKLIARVMQVFAQLLRVGFGDQEDDAGTLERPMVAEFPLWHSNDLNLPIKSNAYFYLDLFGAQQNEENQILEDRDDRIALFRDRFHSCVLTGIEAARQEGGELGRAAGLMTKSLKLSEHD